MTRDDKNGARYPVQRMAGAFGSTEQRRHRLQRQGRGRRQPGGTRGCFAGRQNRFGRLARTSRQRHLHRDAGISVGRRQKCRQVLSGRFRFRFRDRNFRFFRVPESAASHRSQTF